MGEAIQQGGGHFGVAEHGRPFAESEIGGDEDRGAFVEPADEVEQQLAAGLGERQVADFVEDDEVEPAKAFGETSLMTGPSLGIEPVDQVDDGVEWATGALADTRSGDRHHQMALAGAGAADQDDVAPLGEEAADRKSSDQRLVDR